jgi:hypothetical protein
MTRRVFDSTQHYAVVVHMAAGIVRSESEFRGDRGFSVFDRKRGPPPTLLSETLYSKKIEESGKKSAKIAKSC